MSDTPTQIPAPASPPRLGWATSPTAKLGLILGLVIVLQAPLFAVSSLIGERQDRQEEVLTGIRRSWGPAQALTGTTLAIPYVWTDPATATAPAQRRRGWVRVPPHTLSVKAALTPETRQRGLFRATVYTAALQIEGTITVPPIDMKDTPSAELLWNEAILATGATDLRGQPANGTMMLDDRAVPLSIDVTSGCGAVAVAPAGLKAAPAPGTVIRFGTALTLRGTQSFTVVPWGQQIEMAVRAAWQTPSFNGVALPLAYTIDASGFEATWQASGDAAAGAYNFAPAPLPACGASDSETQIGVDLLEAVPTYLMVTRTAKYGTLFLALAFLTYFLIEQGARIRIHLAQYGLLGLSISLFALIVVAVAEPLGFTAGYAIGTAAVMAQASLYTLSVTQRPRLASMFAGVLAVLFGLLYVVLRLENFALLGGTAALFAILSVVMAATRRLDWSARVPDAG